MNRELAFKEAAEALVVASHELETGRSFIVGSLIALALYRISGELVPRSRRSRRQRKGSTADSDYEFRWRILARQFGIEPPAPTAIHRLRLDEVYPVTARDHPKRGLSPRRLRDALDQCAELLRDLADQHPEPIPSALREHLQRLASPDRPPPLLRQMDLLERLVRWGIHDPTLRPLLTDLELEFRFRDSDKALGHRAHALTMLSHVGLNEGGPDAVRTGVGTGELAREILVRLQDREGVVYCLNTLSALYRSHSRLQLRRSLECVDLASQWAGDDPDLRESIDSERASILANMWQGEEAAAVLEAHLQRAKDEGPGVEAWRRLQVGKALAHGGAPARARDTLLASLEALPQDFCIAHCTAANALTELCARLGEDHAARKWAARTRKLAVEKGYENQLRKLEATERRYPRTFGPLAAPPVGSRGGEESDENPLTGR